MKPENTSLEKKKYLQYHQFLGSMLVFGGVLLTHVHMVFWGQLANSWT